MKDRELKLTPINPFTPQQQNVIRLKLEGKLNKQIASELGISPHTVHAHIGGTDPSLGTRASRGIIGVIEEATGTRPKNDWLLTLMGDVIVDVNSE